MKVLIGKGDVKFKGKSPISRVSEHCTLSTLVSCQFVWCVAPSTYKGINRHSGWGRGYFFSVTYVTSVTSPVLVTVTKVVFKSNLPHPVAMLSPRPTEHSLLLCRCDRRVVGPRHGPRIRIGDDGGRTRHVIQAHGAAWKVKGPHRYGMLFHYFSKV